MVIMVFLIFLLLISPSKGTFDCFQNRLPLNIGCESADTAITSITGDLYFGGWTKCPEYLVSGGTQSAIVGKTDIGGYVWLVNINSVDVNSIEAIEMHTNLFVLAKGIMYFIYSIDPSNGSILMSKKITGVSSLYSNAPRSADIYFAVKKTSNQMGIFRLKDFENSLDIEWYAYLDCSTLVSCNPAAIAESNNDPDFIYFASTIQEASKTVLQIRHFDKSGTEQWTAFLDQGSSSYYTVKKMAATSSNLVVISENTDVLITVLSGLDGTDHSVMPQEQVSFKLPVIGATSITNYGGNSMYLMAYDTSQKFIKIDFTNSLYKIQEISSTYKVFDTLTSLSSFYFAGHSSGFSDGTISKSFTGQQGFIMFSNTDDQSQNCLSNTYDWNPLTGLTTYQNDTSVGWEFEVSVLMTVDTSQSLQNLASIATIGSTNLLTANSVIQQWCWGATETITISPPSDLGVSVNNISYTPYTSQSQTFSPFTTSGDSSCTAYDLVYTIQIEREGVLIPDYPVLDSATSTLTLDRDDNYFKGNHAVNISATLPNNFQMTAVSALFNLYTASTCYLLTLSAPTSGIQNFILASNNGVESHSPTPFSLESSLGCEVSYLFEFTNYVQGPNGKTQTFLTYSGGVVQDTEITSTAAEFYILNEQLVTNIVDDNTLEGTYTIRLTANSDYTQANPSVVNFYTFEVEVQFNCSIETITSNSIADMSYTIYAVAEVFVVPEFTFNSACTLTYSLLVNGLDPTDAAKVSTEERQIVEFDSSTRTVTVQSDENQHGDKTINLTVTAVNLLKSHSVSFNLVTSKDCNYATLDLDSSFNRTLEYFINNSAPTELVSSLEGLFSTNDSNCPFTYMRSTYDSSYVLPSWTDNNYQLGEVQDSLIGDFIWQDSNEIHVITDDNSNEAHSESTNLIGPILINVIVSNTFKQGTTVYTLYIYPDCTLETISLPSVSQSTQSYTIYDSNLFFNLNDFTYSRAYCNAKTYTVVYDHGAENFITFQSSNKRFKVQTNDNMYGDLTITITVTGVTEMAYQETVSFNLNTIKNCEYVELQASTFNEAIYYYPLTGDAISIASNKFTQVANEHATEYCYTVYEIQYKIKGSSSGFTTYSAGMSDTFVQSFDTASSLTENFVTIYSTVVELEDIYQFQIVGKVDPSLQGVFTIASSTEFEILSICNAAFFTSMQDITYYDYFIRHPQLLITFNPITPSWPQASYDITGTNQAELFEICGVFSYHIYNHTTNSSSFHSAFNFENMIMTLYSTDPLLASYSSQSYSTEYEFMIEAYMGVHYKNKAYFQFKIEVKDYCWVTKILEKPKGMRLYDTTSLVKMQIEIPFSPFIDTVTYNIQNEGNSLYPNENFPAGYSCNDFSYSAKMVNHLTYDLTPTSTFIQFYSSILTFRGYVDRNDDAQVFYYQLTVQSNIFAQFTPAVVSLQMEYFRCKPNFVNIPAREDFSYNIKGGMKYKTVHRGVKGFQFAPLCPYNKFFTSTFANGTALPDWIQFDTGRDFNQWYQIDLIDTSLAWQSLEIQTQFIIFDNETNLIEHDHPNVIYNRLYNWTLNLTAHAFKLPNDPPFYLEPVRMIIEFDQSTNYSYVTPGVSSDTGSVEVTFSPSSLRQFMTFKTDKDTLITTFLWTPSLPEHFGKFSVMIRLYDNDDEDDPKSKLYVFGVAVNQILREEVLQEDKIIEEVVRNPVMSLQSIDQVGICYFKFDQQMVVPEEYLGFDDAKVREILFVAIRPGQDQDREKTTYSSLKITSYTPTEMQLTVVFNNPLFISMAETPDVIRIQVLDNSYFQSEETRGYLDYAKSEYKHNLPFQMIPGDASNSFMLGTENLGGSLQIFVYLNFLISFMLSASLGQLWSLMNCLQLALHLSALNVKIPPNATFFSSKLLAVVQFDIIPENLVKYFYFWKYFDGTYLQEEEEMDEEITEFQDDFHQENESRLRNLNLRADYYNSDDGEQETNYVINYQLIFCKYDSFQIDSVMGTLYIVIVYNFIFFLLIFVARIIERTIYHITGYENQMFNTKYKNLTKNLFWNGPIRFIMESYLEVMIAVLIAMHKKVRFSTYELIVSNVTLILCLITYSCAPFLIIFTIIWERKKITREGYWIEYCRQSNAYKDKLTEIFPIYSLYGEALFQDTKFRLSTIILNGIFLMRRQILALTIIFLSEYPIFQVIIFLLSTFFYMFYLGFTQPYRSILVNHIETFNEFMLMLICYTYLLYTDFVQDIEMRYLIGWITVAGCAIVIVVNIVLMTSTQFTRYKVKVAKKKTQARYDEYMKKIQKEFEEAGGPVIEKQRPSLMPREGNYKSFQFHTKLRERGQFNRFAHLMNVKVNTQGLHFSREDHQMSVIKEETEEDSIDEKMKEMGIIVTKKVEYRLPQKIKKIKPNPLEQIFPDSFQQEKTEVASPLKDIPQAQSPGLATQVVFNSQPAAEDVFLSQSAEDVFLSQSAEDVQNFEYFMPKPYIDEAQIEMQIRRQERQRIKNINILKDKIKQKMILEQAKRDFEILDHEGEWSDLQASRFQMKN